ncbi:MAG: hypothetical protein Q7T16_00760 [Candidatus Burarchaeum sp.]|nr:hypothetical protein [Candidatus Burarchaeum sp.]MDO8339167.1 hypothetical protein [Candidatus Burarchaeum sp.]
MTMKNMNTNASKQSGIKPFGVRVRNAALFIGTLTTFVVGAHCIQNHIQNQRPITDGPVPLAISAPPRENSYDSELTKDWNAMLNKPSEEHRAEMVKDWTANDCAFLKEKLCIYEHPYTAKNKKIAGVIDKANKLGIFVNNPEIFQYITAYLDIDPKFLITKASGHATVMDGLKFAITQAEIQAIARQN